MAGMLRAIAFGVCVVALGAIVVGFPVAGYQVALALGADPNGLIVIVSTAASGLFGVCFLWGLFDEYA